MDANGGVPTMACASVVGTQTGYWCRASGSPSAILVTSGLAPEAFACAVLEAEACQAASKMANTVTVRRRKRSL